MAVIDVVSGSATETIRCRSGGVIEIPIDEVQVDDLLVGPSRESVLALAWSMALEPVSPFLVRQTIGVALPFELVFGRLRLLAMRELGRPTIPARGIACSSRTVRSIRSAEHAIRTGARHPDPVRAVAWLRKTFDLPISALAEEFEKSIGWITDALACSGKDEVDA